MFTDIVNQILDGTGWEAQDDSVLISCCGELAEYDCPTCPGCGDPNPMAAYI